MSEGSFTRRTFLACAAGAAALAGSAELAGCAAPKQAASGATGTAHVLCAGCSNKCGYTAYVVDGAVTKTIGDNHPAAGRRLCAEGYGAVLRAMAADDRATKPMKRAASGSYENISWDEALSAIAADVESIVAADGPDALALVHGARPTGVFYGRRLMSALGSPNVYDVDALPGLSKASGFSQVIGADAVSDYENADAVLVMGVSALDALSPAEVAALQKARSRGAQVFYAGPRLDAAATLATQWVPVNPGTELAFVLGMTGTLVRNGRYDADYVARNVEGFDEWRTSAFAYTSQWAEDLCGVPSATIEQVANALASAAPAASISLGHGVSSYRGYSNAGELARAAAVFNTLLGCWNRPGGAAVLDYDGRDAGADALGALPAAVGKAYGAGEYPLAAEPSVMAMIKGLKGGAIKALFVCDVDLVGSCPDTPYVEQALQSAELVVAVGPTMTPTMEFADYVLPSCSFLEQMELPDFTVGARRAVAIHEQAVEPACPDALPLDQVITRLAQACGVEQHFDFTLEDAAMARLASTGLDLAGLKAAGTAYLETVAADRPWKTPNGKIQFTSAACEAAGLSAAPSWLVPAFLSSEGDLKVVGGMQPSARRASSLSDAPLADIARGYGLERIWLSAGDAHMLGIADGDTVGVSNDSASGKIRAKVTARVVPGAAYLPDNFGVSGNAPADAGLGVDRMAFVSFGIEPGYGGPCDAETSVRVWKAGM